MTTISALSSNSGITYSTSSVSVSSQSSEISSLESQIQDLEDQKSELQSELQSTSSDQQQVIQTQITTIESQISTLESQISNLKQQSSVTNDSQGTSNVNDSNDPSALKGSLSKLGESSKMLKNEIALQQSMGADTSDKTEALENMQKNIQSISSKLEQIGADDESEITSQNQAFSLVGNLVDSQA